VPTKPAEAFNGELDCIAALAEALLLEKKTMHKEALVHGTHAHTIDDKQGSPYSLFVCTVNGHGSHFVQERKKN